jgi:hypothetical protein
MPIGWLVLDVEPLLLPVLDRVAHPKVEVAGWALHRDNGASNVMYGGLGDVAPDEEDAALEPQWGSTPRKHSQSVSKNAM